MDYSDERNAASANGASEQRRPHMRHQIDYRARFLTLKVFAKLAVREKEIAGNRQRSRTIECVKLHQLARDRLNILGDPILRRHGKTRADFRGTSDRLRQLQGVSSKRAPTPQVHEQN